MKTILDLIFKWVRKKSEEFQIDNVGVLKLDRYGSDYFWLGNIPDIIQSGIHLELGIEVDGNTLLKNK